MNDHKEPDKLTPPVSGTLYLEVDELLEKKLEFLKSALGIKHTEDLITHLIYKEFDQQVMQMDMRQSMRNRVMPSTPMYSADRQYDMGTAVPIG